MRMEGRSDMARRWRAGFAALLVVAAVGVVGCASDARGVPGATTPESAPSSEVREAASTSSAELSSVTVAPGRVEWFGDSLTASSVAELRAAFASAFGWGWSLEVSSFGGTALCDWTAEIHDALRSQVRPALIVLAFYGNNFTPCMGAVSPERPTIEQGSPGFYDRYRSAIEQVARWSDQTGVPVIWVQAPPRAPEVAGGPVGVRDGLDALAREQGWPVLEAGRALADRTGGFAAWLPCDRLDGSACIDGQVKVRSDDLVHFEPSADPGEFSPGSRRWADEAFALIADTVGT